MEFTIKINGKHLIIGAVVLALVAGALLFLSTEPFPPKVEANNPSSYIERAFYYLDKEKYKKSEQDYFTAIKLMEQKKGNRR